MKNRSSFQDEVDASTLNLLATTSIGNPKKKYPHSTLDIAEAESIYWLPFSQESQLIKLEPFQDNQSRAFKKEHRCEEASKLYEMYYPDGLPDPDLRYDQSEGSGFSS